MCNRIEVIVANVHLFITEYVNNNSIPKCSGEKIKMCRLHFGRSPFVHYVAL